MTRKKIILIILAFLIVGQIFAQRRTTNVKGYYRKDGTYVRPHTRHYNAGTGNSSSSNTYYNGANNKSDDTQNIPLSTLEISPLEQSDYSHSTSKYKNGKGDRIQPAKVITVLDEVNPSLSETLDTSNQQSAGALIYISVLRYNGRTIDICPITRGYFSEWEFDKVHHSFDKKLISTVDALDLISNYGWRISDETISKDYTYNYSDKGLPEYLTKTIEALKLK